MRVCNPHTPKLLCVTNPQQLHDRWTLILTPRSKGLAKFDTFGSSGRDSGDGEPAEEAVATPGKGAEV